MNAEQANIKGLHSVICSEQNQARGSVFFLGVELAQRGHRLRLKVQKH